MTNPRGAVDLSALRTPREPVDTAKASTTEAPQDNSSADIQAVMRALDDAYDSDVAKRRRVGAATPMVVLPRKAMAQAAIAAMGRFPAIPAYDDEEAREARYSDLHRPEIDPEEYHVPDGGELPPEALPEVSHAMVWADEEAVAHLVVDIRHEAAVDLTMTPDEAERYHLAGLAAVHAARANVARRANDG